MLYIIMIIIGIGIIASIIETIKEYFWKIVLFALAIVGVILLAKGSIWLFHLIGGWTAILKILKYIGIFVLGILALIFIFSILINVFWGIRKSFAKIRIKNVFTDMLSYTSQLPYNISYNDLVENIKEKYQHISIKPYEIIDLINRAIDTFVEKNVLIIESFMEEKLRTCPHRVRTYATAYEYGK